MMLPAFERRFRGILALALGLGLLGACATTDSTEWDDGSGGDVRDTDGETGDCPGGCPAGQTCVGGRCVGVTCSGGDCPAGQTCCDGYCVETRNDPLNCGGCGNVCAPGGDGCFSGTCACGGAAACTSGRSCCPPPLGCIDTAADPEHCGGCSTVCLPGEECLAGICGGSCMEGCPDVPHGRTACSGERCAISSCDEGWADVDGIVGNGCECEVTAEPDGGETCDTAIDIGSISDAGESLTADGNILPVDDVDWFRFTATDTPDTSCDDFYVDIRFEENPGDQFAFEVFVGDCATLLCGGDVLFSYATDFNDTTGPEIRGECPCTTENTAGRNLCSDTTRPFFVKVRRLSTSSGGSCDGYRLAISNGIRSTASP